MIVTPIKPFDTYKWRWLSVAPTESLLDSSVFLGVLRVLAKHENVAPSNPAVLRDLDVVQRETNTSVNLVRTPERNLIRNSGQYWKGTGLISSERGNIQLTPLGRQVAEGTVTQGEFAAVMVQQTILPNPWTYGSDEIQKWQQADLQIKPLALILEIIEHLSEQDSSESAYITPFELLRIVIPLAGVKAQVVEIAQAMSQHRNNVLDISNWSDCAPDANDKRLGREFLLFLANFGLCRRISADNNLGEKYYLDDYFDAQSFSSITSDSIFLNEASVQNVIEAVRHSPLPSIIERRRTTASILSRPEQAKFRSGILEAYNYRCFLTNESIPEVLEAAHIIPVKDGGSDAIENGICLRVDIHRLFDSGNIRIKASGLLSFSDAVQTSSSYRSLPRSVSFPSFTSSTNIAWREKYC